MGWGEGEATGALLEDKAERGERREQPVLVRVRVRARARVRARVRVRVRLP